MPRTICFHAAARLLFAIACAASAAAALAYSGEELAGQARITIARARQIALKAHPGRITDEELEHEDGGSGLRWLRKAVLRAAGGLALHDEDAAYASEADALRADAPPRRGLDKIAFLATFKSVVLEGLEVVFIVLAIGASGRLLAPAVAGAALALALVVALGLLLHRPLSLVPENTLKFCVGAMLSAFGTFWVGEGLGLDWTGGDRALLALIGLFVLAPLLMVAACAWMRPAVAPDAEATTAITPAGRQAGAIASVVQELIGLLVDDGWLAAGILVILAGAWVAIPRLGAAPPGGWGIALAGALLTLLAASALRRSRA